LESKEKQKQSSSDVLSRADVYVPETRETQNSSDLLGDDSFSSFISAPPTQTNNSKIIPEDFANIDKTVQNAESEEESFFNQTIPVEKQKTKLDKDSILALYSNTPTMPQHQNSVGVSYQASGGFLYTQANLQGYCGFSHGGQSPYMASQLSQFQNGPPTVQFPGTYSATGVPIVQSPNAAQPMLKNANIATQRSSPFCGNQMGTLQQLGNLTLNNVTPSSNSVPKITSNIWE